MRIDKLITRGNVYVFLAKFVYNANKSSIENLRENVHTVCSYF